MAELAAAITAGGCVDGTFAARIGTDVKALAPWRGAKLVDAALTAARGAGATRIAVVGSQAVLDHCAGRIDEAVLEAPTGEANLSNALATSRGEALLFLTSDMPFVDAAALAPFLALARGCDLAMPLAEVADYERAYPHASDHVTRIGRDRVAGGSAFFFGPGAAARFATIATRLFSARKSIWAMARLLGPFLLARFALGALRIADVERRAQRIFGMDARGIRHSAPQLCYDVDTLAEYEYALEHADG
jgi:CTP:molybdopterin cytidylyltransferase MocA